LWTLHQMSKMSNYAILDCGRQLPLNKWFSKYQGHHLLIYYKLHFWYFLDFSLSLDHSHWNKYCHWWNHLNFSNDADHYLFFKRELDKMFQEYHFILLGKHSKLWELSLYKINLKFYFNDFENQIKFKLNLIMRYQLLSLLFVWIFLLNFSNLHYLINLFTNYDSISNQSFHYFD